RVSGLADIGANQLFDNNYKNYTFADNLTWQKGSHQLKGGLLVAYEQKNELPTSATQGTLSLAARGGFTAFQNFLRGNSTGACGAACTYLEPEREVNAQIRFHREEFYLQDSWRVRSNLRFDFGLRVPASPSLTDLDDELPKFVPERFDPAAAPTFAD